MEGAPCQLIVQLPNPKSLDDVVALEDRIRDLLGESADVDGHDIGTAKANIFVHTRDPILVFRAIERLVAPIPSVRVAYRVIGDEDCGYRILFPPTLTAFDVA